MRRDGRFNDLQTQEVESLERQADEDVRRRRDEGRNCDSGVGKKHRGHPAAVR